MPPKFYGYPDTWQESKGLTLEWGHNLNGKIRYTLGGEKRVSRLVYNPSLWYDDKKKSPISNLIGVLGELVIYDFLLKNNVDFEVFNIEVNPGHHTLMDGYSLPDIRLLKDNCFIEVKTTSQKKAEINHKSMMKRLNWVNSVKQMLYLDAYLRLIYVGIKQRDDQGNYVVFDLLDIFNIPALEWAKCAVKSGKQLKYYQLQGYSVKEKIVYHNDIQGLNHYNPPKSPLKVGKRWENLL